MDEIKIETNVPIQRAFWKKVKISLIDQALRSIEIGESFVLPEKKWAHQVASAANRNLKPKRFLSRKQPDGRYRIWRIA